MNGKLYVVGKKDPVAVLDSVEIVSLNDNHENSPERIFYRTSRLSAGKKQVELYRTDSMKLELEDGRSCQVIMQHTSLDAEGAFVGVLRILDELKSSE